MPQLPNSSNTCLSIRASRHSTGTKQQEWEPLLSISGTYIQGVLTDAGQRFLVPVLVVLRFHDASHKTSVQKEGGFERQGQEAQD